MGVLAHPPLFTNYFLFRNLKNLNSLTPNPLLMVRKNLSLVFESSKKSYAENLSLFYVVWTVLRISKVVFSLVDFTAETDVSFEKCESDVFTSSGRTLMP